MFRDVSIRTKLLLLLTGSVSLVLSLVCLAFVISDRATVKASMVQQMTALADILGANCEVPLNFNDPAEAQRVLTSLQREPTVAAAAVYDSKGTVFAIYVAPDASFEPSDRPPAPGHVFADGFLHLVKEIKLSGTLVGTVYLRASTKELDARLTRSLLIAAIVWAVSLLVVLGLGLALQRVISEPIAQLARAARRVSDEANYAIRVEKSSEDELGVLCDGFNAMLEQIQHRDTKLATLAAIIESSDDAIIGKTLDGIVTSWNRGAELLYGYTASEMVGQPISCLFPPDRAGEFPTMLERLRRGESVDHFETVRMGKDGTCVDVSLTISPIRDSDGKIVGGSTIAHDITERKQTERQLAQYAAELERSNQELDQFAYSASHDLRAPLRAVDQLAAWMVEDHADNLPDEVRDDLNLMRCRIQRMERLLDDLLQYSRVGRMEGDLETIDCQTLVRNVVDLLAPPAEFTVEISRLPTIKTHRTPLEQVFRNLIGNAVKHHDREDGLVEVTGKVNGSLVEFIVRDDGPGIPAEFHNQVFGMFQTLKARDELEGSGMGLALVKKIVESRGGAIQLDSAEGAGATFCFTWPARN